MAGLITQRPRVRVPFSLLKTKIMAIGEMKIVHKLNVDQKVELLKMAHSTNLTGNIRELIGNYRDLVNLVTEV